MTFEQILKDLCNWCSLNETDPTPQKTVTTPALSVGVIFREN